MAYNPPTVYSQGSYPHSSQQSPYPAAAGWMGPPPSSGQGPPSTNSSLYSQPSYPQQQQQPYPQQQHQPYAQQPYPQQQHYQQPYQQQQPYPQQQPPAVYGQSSFNQHFSNPGAPYAQAAAPPPAAVAVQNPGSVPYLPPTTYSPPAVEPQPTGRKKALLIGCAYPGTAQALNGCINDVQCIEYCLKHRFGFTQPGSIVVLRDDSRQPDYVSTRANILRGIQWLMQDQRPGDSLFFHFSGHGSQQQDRSGDEIDGQDETILPTDYKRAGVIVDDDLNAMMVRPLQQGVTLHALVDACHSGTAMDLPYRARYSDQRFSWKLKTRKIKGTSGGTAFQFGACKDSQVAADTNSMSGSSYTGAATFSFIDAVERYGVQQTYASLLQHMMETLSKQAGGGSGLAGLPSGLSSVAGKLSSLGGMAGGLTGMASGLVSSFLLGPGALGGQVPVVCCDKQIDLYSTRLAI